MAHPARQPDVVGLEGQVLINLEAPVEDSKSNTCKGSLMLKCMQEYRSCKQNMTLQC